MSWLGGCVAQAPPNLLVDLPQAGVAAPSSAMPLPQVKAVPQLDSFDILMGDFMVALPSALAAEQDAPKTPANADASPVDSSRGGAPGGVASDTDVSVQLQDSVRVVHDLCVHGEAWKAGGSTQWRVLSDARVKDVLSTFALGGGTLAHVVPRLFRYRGQPEHERPYAGIIAQELPPELAPFCRFRTDLPALATDAALACPPSPTGEGRAEEEGEGLYLVDLSALQFVILNAATELQRQVRSRVISRDHTPRPDLGCGSGPTLP